MNDSDSRRPLTGRCLCGEVEFSLTAPPIDAGWCHCSRCQHRTGSSASPQLRITPDTSLVTGGQELVRSFHPPDGLSKVFCSAYGSALWACDGDGDGVVVAVRFGVLDGDPGIRPSYRQFVG